MSSAIKFLKRIDEYTPEATLKSFQCAATKAKIFVFGFRMDYDEVGKSLGGEGALSEIDQATLLTYDSYDSHQTKTFLFGVNTPEESDYDSFTWLVNEPNYFEAVYIRNPFRYDDGEFIFHFVVKYFEDNPDDFLWNDSTSEKFFYTASDIKKLSTMPFDPMWSERKLV